MEIRIDESDLLKVQTELDRLPEIMELATKESVRALAIGYKSAAEFVGAKDSGDFIASIHERDGTVGVEAAREIVSDVGYSAIVEAGRSDNANYPRRFPAEKALEAFDQGDVFEQKLNDALREFLED